MGSCIFNHDDDGGACDDSSAQPRLQSPQSEATGHS